MGFIVPGVRTHPMGMPAKEAKEETNRRSSDDDSLVWKVVEEPHKLLSGQCDHLHVGEGVTGTSIFEN